MRLDSGSSLVCNNNNSKYTLHELLALQKNGLGLLFGLKRGVQFAANREDMIMKQEKCTAIVLAAGQGKRMGTKMQKQYLEIGGHPILYYSLKAFPESALIDEIVLVVGAGQEQFCRENVLAQGTFSKIVHIVEGGAERYNSVWNALQVIDGGYVFIHDGARPFVTEDIIARAFETVTESKACVVGMPVKDTIKIADDTGNVSATPDRSKVWMIQTPQVFETALVKGAYAALMDRDDIQVTDDAMVVETMTGHPVKLVRGSYENIKVTTPEDLEVGAVFVKRLMAE